MTYEYIIVVYGYISLRLYSMTSHLRAQAIEVLIKERFIGKRDKFRHEETFCKF